MAVQTQMTGIEFKRESNRNYMIIRSGSGDTQHNAVRMLSGNPIPGLLPFHEKVFNGETLFYYDITSKQPLKRILESRDITGAELRSLLMDLLSVLGEMERFLLDEDELVLDADLIYVDPDTFGTGWCVMPGGEGNFPERFKEFSQYLLDHISNNDSEAVVLAFGIFRQSRKENFGLPDIERELQKSVNVVKPGTDAPAEFRRESVYNVRPDTDHFKSIASETSVRDGNKRQDGPAAEKRDVKEGGGSGSEDPDGSRKVSPLYYLLVIPIMLLAPVIVCFRYGIAGIFVFAPMIAAADIVIGAAGILLIRTLIIRPQKNKQSSGQKREREKKRPEIEDERTEREELEIIFKEADDPGIQRPYRLPSENAAGGRERICDCEDLTGTCDPADDDAFRTVLLTSQPVEFSRRKLISLTDGRTIPVPYFPFLIGKNKNICDFCPDDEGVSRLHLKIENEKDEYIVTDLNSTNGTYINGKLLEPDETCEIKPGDEIRIAAGRYRFE